MLKCETEIPEIARVIEKYGKGFDVIYFDGFEEGYALGFEEGYAVGFAKGQADANLKIARKLFDEKVDGDIIFRCTGFTTNQIKLSKTFK